ncbi:MAG: hypothetical protein JWO22_65 [Frankiales bacterium]|nr:hypothetical protein [Frankiales bacterium]
MSRLRPRDDEGNIMIALLGIIVITSIVLVGLAQMLISERVTRHDRNFEQALSAAETGLAKLLTQVKATPYRTSLASVSGTDSRSSATWTASASGGSGHWVLTASGTATGSATRVTRTITQSVDVADLLSHPLFATTQLTLGGGSADSVDTYDSSVDSSVCATTGLALPTGMTASGTRMCTHASPALGRIGTNGPLTLPHDSLANLAGADIYAAGTPGYPDPLDTGSCAGDSTTCASAQVVTHPDPLGFPLSSQCASGVGAGAAAYDGSLALAANAVYNFTDVTLNATAIANLANISGSTLVICFSGELDIVPTVPINSVVTDPLTLRTAPRPPSTLVLISTSSSTGTPTIKLNAGLALPSKVSAVIYAPNATCSATAHVDLYGAMVCGKVTASSGIDVHYDVQVGKLPFDQPVTVSAWREK